MCCVHTTGRECIMLMSIVDSLHNIFFNDGYIQLDTYDDLMSAERVKSERQTLNIYFIIELLKRLTGLVWGLAKSRNMHQILSTCSIFMFAIHLTSLARPPMDCFTFDFNFQNSIAWWKCGKTLSACAPAARVVTCTKKNIVNEVVVKWILFEVSAWLALNSERYSIWSHQVAVRLTML